MTLKKDSGIEWIGDIPQTWFVKPLYAVGDQVRSKNNSGSQANLLSLSYGEIKEKDIDKAEGLLPESFDTYQEIKPGDLVFRFTDLQNDKRSLRSAVNGFVGIITSAYLAFRPKSIDSQYLGYLMRFYDTTKVFYSMGSGLRQSLKYADVRRMPVLVPPLEEQKAIADFLDRELGQIDALMARLDRFSTQVSERWQTVLDNSVRIGISSSPSKRARDPWIEALCEHWSESRLKFILSAPIVDGPHTTPTFLDSGYPFLSVDAIQDGELVFEGARRISAEDFAEFHAKAPAKRGDLLLGKAASTGKLAQVKTDEPFAIWSPLALLRINARVAVPSFVEYSLKSSLSQAQIETLCTSNTQKNISMRDIPRISIALPPVSEQEEIVSHLDTLKIRYDRLQGTASAIGGILRERRSALISAAVTGKIDVRGKN